MRFMRWCVDKNRRLSYWYIVCWLSYPTGATNRGSSSWDAYVRNGIISRSAQALVVFFSTKGVIHGGLLWVERDRSVEMWCVVALRGNREPGSRYLLAITNRCRVIGGLCPICAVLFVQLRVKVAATK